MNLRGCDDEDEGEGWDDCSDENQEDQDPTLVGAPKPPEDSVKGLGQSLQLAIPPAAADEFDKPDEPPFEFQDGALTCKSCGGHPQALDVAQGVMIFRCRCGKEDATDEYEEQIWEEER